jgi:hypothetical protein
MSVEQVVRDSVAKMNNAEKMKGIVTTDAMAIGGVILSR